MKLALISDTHGQLPAADRFDGVDAVLHAGDIGPDYDVDQWIHGTFARWHHALTQDIGIPFYGTLGNHDNPRWWTPDVCRQFGIRLSETTRIHDQIVFFSPWSPTFGLWPWMKDEPLLMREYEKIPVDCTMIVSHTPPFQLCDLTFLGQQHVGSKALRVRMTELPALHSVICGHIHEGWGWDTLGSIKILNVASVDDRYTVRPEPITFLEV